jgi:hypothetical protein
MQFFLSSALMQYENSAKFYKATKQTRKITKKNKQKNRKHRLLEQRRRKR